MLCINTFGRVMYFLDQAKKKIQNGRTSTLIYFNIINIQVYLIITLTLVSIEKDRVISAAVL